MPKKEFILQKQIINILSLYARKNNFVFFSVPNEAVLLTAGQSRKDKFAIINHLKSLGMLSGVSDIIILKDSKAYCLECKSINGKLTKNQRIFRDNVIRTNCKYAYTDNYDNAMKILKEWGII